MVFGRRGSPTDIHGSDVSGVQPMRGEIGGAAMASADGDLWLLQTDATLRQVSVAVSQVRAERNGTRCRYDVRSSHDSSRAAGSPGRRPRGGVAE